MGLAWVRCQLPLAAPPACKMSCSTDAADCSAAGPELALLQAGLPLAFWAELSFPAALKWETALQGLFASWTEQQGALLAAEAVLQGWELELYEQPDYVMAYR